MPFTTLKDLGVRDEDITHDNNSTSTPKTTTKLGFACLNDINKAQQADNARYDAYGNGIPSDKEKLGEVLSQLKPSSPLPSLGRPRAKANDKGSAGTSVFDRGTGRSLAERPKKRLLTKGERRAKEKVEAGVEKHRRLMGPEWLREQKEKSER